MKFCVDCAILVATICLSCTQTGCTWFPKSSDPVRSPSRNKSTADSGMAGKPRPTYPMNNRVAPVAVQPTPALGNTVVSSTGTGPSTAITPKPLMPSEVRSPEINKHTNSGQQVTMNESKPTEISPPSEPRASLRKEPAEAPDSTATAQTNPPDASN